MNTDARTRPPPARRRRVTQLALSSAALTYDIAGPSMHILIPSDYFTICIYNHIVYSFPLIIDLLIIILYFFLVASVRSLTLL